MVWRFRILIVIWFLFVPLSAGGQTEDASNDEVSCSQDIEQLTSSLLEDLPGYSNRVIQRTQRVNRQEGIRNFIVTAAQAEFEPLNLPRIEYGNARDDDTEQVFFTVLERQYTGDRVATIQTYHWLFLTRTDNGWQTVMMFSRFGNSQDKLPPAPPRETTDGIIGRGVQLWLRDCRAGRVDLQTSTSDSTPKVVRARS